MTPNHNRFFMLYARYAQELAAPSSQTELVTPRPPLHFTVSLTLALACVEGMHRAEGTQLTKQRQVRDVPLLVLGSPLGIIC